MRKVATNATPVANLSVTNGMYSIFVPTKKEAEQIFESDRFFLHKGFTGLEYKGQFVTVTGIGKVNTAITLTRYFTAPPSAPSSPLLLGIGGAYRGTLNAGDVCLISTDHFVDESLITDNNQLSLTGTHEMGFPICDENKVTFATPKCEALRLKFVGLPVYTANTVSLLSGTDELANLYRNKTGASVESMEGAAFGLVCLHFDTAAVQIRAVSNYCGARENQQWNIKKAIQALQDVLHSL